MKKFCIGIHVLIQRDNKYLILLRSKHDDADPGCWDLAGGGIKFGEQPLAAALREAKEEAGVKIKPVKILSTWALYYKEYKVQWSVEINILAKYVSGPVKLSKEHSDYKWVTKKELLNIKPKGMTLKHLPKNI